MTPGAAASLESYASNVQIEIIMDDNQVAKIDGIDPGVGKQFADSLSALVHEGLGFR
jgi:citrate lyase gamma subunit